MEPWRTSNEIADLDACKLSCKSATVSQSSTRYDSNIVFCQSVRALASQETSPSPRQLGHFSASQSFSYSVSQSVSQSVTTHPIFIQPGTCIPKNILLIKDLSDQVARELEGAIQDLHEATCVRFRP